MNGYLVTAVLAFDRRPLRLFATREEAIAFAERVRQVEATPPTKPGCLLGEAGTVFLEDRLYYVEVVPFANGVPGETIPVKDFLSPRQTSKKRKGVRS